MSRENEPQSFENHVVVPWRWLAALSLFAVGIVVAAASIVWPLRAAQLQPIAVLAACGAGMYTLWILRGNVTRLQDRVIRAEMRARLYRLLPNEDAGLVDKLSVRQLIGLRFASDEELPALVDYVLADEVHDVTAIKKRIKNWQADRLRV